MLIDYQNGQTGIILRVLVQQDTSGANPGYGFTGLANTSSGLNVSTIADNEAAATSYTSAGSTIQTIATLGTYAAPSSSDCRLMKVDDTNLPGLVEIQLANARYAVSGAKSLVVFITGVTGMMPCRVTVPLRAVNPYDGVRGGMTAFPSVATGNAGAVLVDGTGTAAISNSSGKVLLQATQTGVTIPTVTAVGSVSGAVGSVTGAVGSVTAAVTVTGTPTVNVTEIAGQTANAAGAVTFPGSIGTSTYAGGAVASVTGAVGSVTGNVGGSVAGDVQGKVLGGGSSSISAVGVQADLQTIGGNAVVSTLGKLWVLDSNGNAVATASALSALQTTMNAVGVAVVALGSPMQAGASVVLAGNGVDAVVVETGLNLRQAVSIIASSAAGVLAGAAGTTVAIAAAGVPATNRITATVDSSGDRSSVSLSPPT